MDYLHSVLSLSLPRPSPVLWGRGRGGQGQAPVHGLEERQEGYPGKEQTKLGWKGASPTALRPFQAGLGAWPPGLGPGHVHKLFE